MNDSSQRQHPGAASACAWARAGVVALALAVAPGGAGEVAAEDAFYAVRRASATGLGTAPKEVTVPGRPDKAPKSASQNDVIVRHNLEKNTRTEVLRINQSLWGFSASHGGRRLTYLVAPYGEGAKWQICATDLDGKAIGRLTAAQFKEKYNGRPFGAPALSPDEGTILFGARISPAPRVRTQARIIAYDIKSQALADFGPGTMPAWSPDGKAILFTEPVGDPSKSGPSRLAVMAADGGGRGAIGEVGTCNGAYSPDGKKIAFVKVVAGASEVWACAADGSAPRKVSAPESLYSSPRWLSDGRRLVVVAVHKDMKPAVRETLARMKGKKGGKPGAPIYDARLQSSEPKDVYVISTAGPNVRRLTALKPPAGDLAFFVDLAATGTITGAAERQAVIDAPVYVPPDGCVVIFRGTKVFLRDKSGATRPLPDGRYKLAPKLIITVLGGKKVIPIHGGDDD